MNLLLLRTKLTKNPKSSNGEPGKQANRKRAKNTSCAHNTMPVTPCTMQIVPLTLQVCRLCCALPHAGHQDVELSTHVTERGGGLQCNRSALEIDCIVWLEACRRLWVLNTSTLSLRGVVASRSANSISARVLAAFPKCAAVMMDLGLSKSSLYTSNSSAGSNTLAWVASGGELLQNLEPRSSHTQDSVLLKELRSNEK